MRLYFSVLMGILLVAIGCGSQSALGASCPYIDQAQQAESRENSLLQTILKTGDCSTIPALLAVASEHNRAIENAVRNCEGYRLTKQADPSAAGRLQASLQDWCKMKQKAAEKPAPEKNQGQTPPQATSRFEPGKAMSCGSDITGTGGPPASTTVCLSKAKWTDSEPYNHAHSPIRFQPFRGPVVNIDFGQSLWSVPDESSPTGRRLEARPWDQQLVTGNCAQEGTSATVRPFVVRIECEIQRQAKLEKEFEAREDTCVSQSRCKRSPDFFADWQSHAASYWRASPQQRIGTCVVGTSDDRRCVREADWHTANECDDYGREATINTRGLLGCFYNEGLVTGPQHPEASLKPEPVTGHWFVIAGSYRPEESAKLNERVKLLSESGISMRIIKTVDYPKLTPGWFSVVLGPFNKEQAEVQLISVRAVIDDAFIKEAF